ncbi:MAG: hypothetical protein Q9174_000148 [Haloplaca sp. 1 TL-2023]
MSSIRVAIEWQKAAFFAGENLECTITFKNVAQDSDASRTALQTHNHRSPRERWKDNSSGYSHQRRDHASFKTSKSPRVGRHHNTSSLTSPKPATRGYGDVDSFHTQHGGPHRRHGRSVSIVSISSDNELSEKGQTLVINPRRFGHGHGRAASLHIFPSRYHATGKSPSKSTSPRVSAPIVPCYDASSSRAPAEPVSASSWFSAFPIGDASKPGSVQESRNGHSGATSPSLNSHKRVFSTSLVESSQLPQLNPASRTLPTYANRTRAAKTYITPPPEQLLRHDHTTPVSDSQGNLNEPLTSAYEEGTPRSSVDFYSVSNNSADTLASEYVHQDHERFPQQSIGTRLQPILPQSKPRQVPETLMMGYGSIVGFFHLDASLMNPNAFDEVKKKGVIGNQGGGGVVRAESSKPRSGLLGSFGWNVLGESFGGLLGSNEVSSIKEATTSSYAKWIPVLSTPQSLLFVDLRLEPGQSKSYSYTYQLPAGLPPSHRGKAVRFSYNLVVGIQRARRSVEGHNVMQLNFPFKVFPSVNGRGETLGHDLMSPHVILHEQPSVAVLDGSSNIKAIPKKTGPQTTKVTIPDKDFRTYITNLLGIADADPSVGLLSPLAVEANGSGAAFAELATVEDNIAIAIQQSASVKPSKMSTTRFEVASRGSRIAVILLARPSYRLGEVIPVTVDFRRSDIRCFSLHTTLETVEHIDPSIALRSQATVSRVTRKILASQRHSTASATRVAFNLAIPSNATPEFITSGVKLNWSLRFELITGNALAETALANPQALLEEVIEDERGSVLAAVQAVTCETFDVTLPIQVFGSINNCDDSDRFQEAAI